MKKLNIFMLLLAGSLLWTGCSDDRDDNKHLTYMICKIFHLSI